MLKDYLFDCSCLSFGDVSQLSYAAATDSKETPITSDMKSAKANTAALIALSGALQSWFRHILTQLNTPAYLG